MLVDMDFAVMINGPGMFALCSCQPTACNLMFMSDISLVSVIIAAASARRLHCLMMQYLFKEGCRLQVSAGADTSLQKRGVRR